MLNAKVTLKGLSETRWSARDDDCRSLTKNWDLVVGVLKTFLDDHYQKPASRCEAKGILKKLNRFECAFIAVFWGDILEMLNKTSKTLQSVSTDLITVVQLYDSVLHYNQSARNRNTFLNYENSAKKLSGLSIFEENEKRKIKRKLQHGENKSNEVTLVGRESFIIKTYYVILDNLLYELQKRKSAYDNLVKTFSFFHNITQYSTEKISQCAKELCEVYPKDLNVNLANEVVQLQGHIKNIETTDNNPKTIQQLMLWIRSNNFLILYPYVEVALRIFLSMPSTNCSAERSFSVLKRVKNYLRSTMSQESSSQQQEQESVLH